MTSIGYSGTPLWKKLGLKEGQTVFLYKPPENLTNLLEGLPDGIRFVKSVRSKIDFIHIFARTKRELETAIRKYRHRIQDNGVIWVSWYKKAAKIPTDITEDTIRQVCLPTGLVDVKVCAVDEQWSGLKLVVRSDNRKLTSTPLSAQCR